MMECPGLKFSESEGLVLVSLEPVAERPQLDVDTLRGMLVHAGYGGCFLFEEALAELVDVYNSPVGEFELAVAERRDGRFSLEVSDDAMFAWISFFPTFGGKAVTPDDILVALGAARVTCGVDEAAIGTLCSNILPARVAVATGVAAENGQHTRFEPLAAETRDRAPQVDENGLIDFRELGAIPTVVPEQPLMRRIPPTEGISGINVHGEQLEPLPGRDEAFAQNLVGACVDIDDANLLRAVFSGQPVRCGNGVMVERVLRVRNVNLASGNITFDGTVHVDGEVMPGMKVRATGDIIVTGVVDGGDLDAAGDVRVGGGVIAHAKVRAGGSVVARFVENAQIYAGEAIAIDDTALVSDLQAMNQIIIGTKARQRGRLAGGSTRAMLLVRAPVLGAVTGGVTVVQLGVNPVLEAKYQDLLQRIEKQRANEANLEKLIKHLSTTGDKAGMLDRAKGSWQLAIQTWAVLLPEKEALEDQLDLISGARLEIGVSVSGAADISFGKKTVRLRRSCDAGAFSTKGEQIVFTDPGGIVTTAT